MPKKLSPMDMLTLVADEISASLKGVDYDKPIWEPIRPDPTGVPPVIGQLQPDGTYKTPQEMALATWADELFYGGAGGGGKTDLLLGAALTQHRNSIIFRQEFTQLRGAEGIMTRSQQLVGTRAEFNESTHMWRGLPGGRTLEFGAARTMKDAAKYRGRPHDLKGFDELPEIPEDVYRFLIGWLRTTYVGQRVRVIATGNPPMTADGQWVIGYWGPWLDRAHPNPAAPGELRWYAAMGNTDIEVPGPKYGPERAPSVQDGERTIYPRSRTFIPARVEDNPYYMRTGYDRVLDAMPEPMRSQMRFGNFHSVAQDHAWQIVPTAWVLAAQARWTPTPPPGAALQVVGCDPSRGGRDQFVLAPRHGGWIGQLKKFPAVDAPDGPRGAQLLYAYLNGDGSVPIQMDIGGQAGPSVYDHSRLLGLYGVAMDGAKRAVDANGAKLLDKTKKMAFANKRAQWHWRVRELLEPGASPEIALPPDPQLLADLVAPRWRPTPSGIRVELKEEIKARLGRSPDCGEAVMYALQDEYADKVETTNLVAW